MRLLHLKTFEFQEFFNEEVPPYAILSHRWGRIEVSFKDMSDKEALESHPGFGKIRDFCTFAINRPRKPSEAVVEWGWIDTCCIDKSGSAELSEAINSMFAWYRLSSFCCVYLADVPPISKGTEIVYDAFGQSEWLTRGWTMQELLAPENVIFCNTSWELEGHKCTHERDECKSLGQGDPLNGTITLATGIRKRYLIDPQAYTKASIACRMSWASHRITARVEDIAYCLLGIFDVHMPPLYGEGTKAFRLLQEEILRRSNDQSIFAWFNIDHYIHLGHLRKVVHARNSHTRNPSLGLQRFRQCYPHQ